MGAHAVSVHDLKYGSFKLPNYRVILTAWFFLCLPISTQNFDFRHFSKDEGLTVSFSKNSPPLAALEDELLPVVKTEPEKEIVLHGKEKLLSAGQNNAWKKLSRISFKPQKTIVAAVKPRELSKIYDVASREDTQIFSDVSARYESLPRASNLDVIIPQKMEASNLTITKKIDQPERSTPLTLAFNPKPINENWKISEIKTPPAPAQNVVRQEQKQANVNQSQLPNEIYKIHGQVELAGGLAVAGHMTKLNIVWKTATDAKLASINYSTGEFLIEVPTLRGGKIFANLTNDNGKVLGRGEYDLTDLASPDQKILEGVKIIIEPLILALKGRVKSAYSYGQVVLPVKDAEIFTPAGIRERADKNGYFKIPSMSSESTFYIDAYAPEHWGTRVMVAGTQPINATLFHHKMIESFLELVGQSANNTELGIVWGEVKRKGQPVSQVKVALANQKAVGPFYFNAFGLPDKKLDSTSDNGLFAFVKVQPGQYQVHAQYQNRELPPAFVNVSPSMITYTEMGFKRVTMRGRVVDPLLQQNIPAEISIKGRSEKVISGAQGFDFKVPSTDPVVFVEANMGSEYYITREGVPQGRFREIELYAFRKAWLAEQFRSIDVRQDESRGLVVGFVQGSAFHAHVEGEDRKSYQDQTIYFDSEGKFDGHQIEGPSGGGFVVTNLPTGLHTVVITSADGEFIATRLVTVEPGIVSLVNIPLRP